MGFFEFLKHSFSQLLNWVYTFVNSLPDVPSISAHMEALDFVSQIAYISSYFLPMSTIIDLIKSTLGFFAFRIVVAVLRSKSGSNFLSKLFDKIKFMFIK